MISSLSPRLNCFYSGHRSEAFLSPRLYGQTRGQKLHLAVPPPSMCCQSKREQQRGPSLLTDRPATAREAEATIRTFWCQLAQNQLKNVFGLECFIPSALVRTNNDFSLEPLQPSLPVLWMLPVQNWVTSNVMKVIKHQKKGGI